MTDAEILNWLGDQTVLGLVDYLILSVLFLITLWRTGIAEQKIYDKIEDKVEELADELIPDRHEGPSFLEVFVNAAKENSRKKAELRGEE